MDNKTPKEKYVPYGPEWEKEMTKFSKPYLIDWLRRELKQKHFDAPALHEKVKELEALLREAKEMLPAYYNNDPYEPVIHKESQELSERIEQALNAK